MLHYIIQRNGNQERSNFAKSQNYVTRVASVCFNSVSQTMDIPISFSKENFDATLPTLRKNVVTT